MINLKNIAFLFVFICSCSYSFAIEKLNDNIVSDLEHATCSVLTLKDSEFDKERIKKIMQKYINSDIIVPSNSFKYAPHLLSYPKPDFEYKSIDTNFYKPSYYQPYNMIDDEIRKDVLFYDMKYPLPVIE